VAVTEGRVEGIVVAQAPSGLYQVEIDGTRRILAHAASGADRNFLRLIVGDRVAVELTARDRTRGRIVRKIL
jgi:translation initiation factor IF-1